MRVESPLLRKLRQHNDSYPMMSLALEIKVYADRVQVGLAWKENLARIGNEERKKVEQTFVRLTFLRILYSRRTFHCERLSEIVRKELIRKMNEERSDSRGNVFINFEEIILRMNVRERKEKETTRDS